MCVYIKGLETRKFSWGIWVKLVQWLTVSLGEPGGELEQRREAMREAESRALLLGDGEGGPKAWSARSPQAVERKDAGSPPELPQGSLGDALASYTKITSDFRPLEPLRNTFVLF